MRIGRIAGRLLSTWDMTLEKLQAFSILLLQIHDVVRPDRRQRLAGLELNTIDHLTAAVDDVVDVRTGNRARKPDAFAHPDAATRIGTSGHCHEGRQCIRHLR